MSVPIATHELYNLPCSIKIDTVSLCTGYLQLISGCSISCSIFVSYRATQSNCLATARLSLLISTVFVLMDLFRNLVETHTLQRMEPLGYLTCKNKNESGVVVQCCEVLIWSPLLPSLSQHLGITGRLFLVQRGETLFFLLLFFKRGSLEHYQWDLWNTTSEIFCNFHRLEVPQQALGGIPLGFGIVVDGKSFELS